MFYNRLIGKPAEGLEALRIGFAASQTEGGSDMEREQVAPVRTAGSPRPAILLQHLDDPQVLRNP
jgi:hypothetical protein